MISIHYGGAHHRVSMQMSEKDKMKDMYSSIQMLTALEGTFVNRSKLVVPCG